MIFEGVNGGGGDVGIVAGEVGEMFFEGELGCGVRGHRGEVDGFGKVDFPDAALAVDGVGSADPVGEVEGFVIGGVGHVDGAEVVGARDKGGAGGVEGGAFLGKVEEVDAVVGPGGDEEFIWAEGDDAAGGFAGASDHAEGAGVLAEPADEGVEAGAAVSVFVSEVGTGNNMKKAIGG